MPKQREGHLAASPIRSKGGRGSLLGPRLCYRSRSPRALWDLVSLGDTVVCSPPFQERRCLTWRRRAVRAYPLSTPTQGRAPLGVSPPGPHSHGAVCRTWQIPSLACRSSTVWLIARLPQTHLSFCSQGKELGLGSGRRDPPHGPKVDGVHEHQQPDCRTSFYFPKIPVCSNSY